ncbi:PREDICTED: sushi domain-containing protein 1 [Gekko japonicus]|uniref:Sushi domain-containing protein 1 n=1 Tax=Gekko japonicus TaxID=146911 RepID=A0ABM1KBH5_GEKJA|nr:PREDICTED: sushi domain-containing protein 1 [Gekko japonicus]
MSLPPSRRRSPFLFPTFLLLLLAPPLPSRAPEEKKTRGATSDFFPSVCESCHADATCQQQDGKPACICNYGFVGNGRTHCQDKDECQIGSSEICGEHASCHNTHGSFYCICLEGFKASNNNSMFIPNDGTHCIDSDECEASDICGLGGLCVNSEGSYKCKCAEGYRTKNGAETFHPPTDRISCEVVDCGIPPSFPNAYMTLVDESTTYGSKVEYTCLSGYGIERGNWTSVCDSRGFWEGANLMCKEIDCGKPLQLPNTDIVWDNTTALGSTVYYKCKKGFQPIGERDFSQCIITKKWENITFECKEIDCGHPPLIPDSEMKWDKTSRLGSVVEYKCNKGFYATSPKTLSYCSHSGSWEILDLRCKKIQPFIDFAVNNSCLTWRRQYESDGVNETYRVTMRVLGNEFKKTANELKINLTTAEEAVKICLPFHPNTNYSIKIEAESSNLVSRFSLINPVPEKEVVFGNISIFNVNCIKWQRKSRTPYEQIYVLHIQGLRWYQKEFLHSVTLDFVESSQSPALCLNLRPGSNYTVNISTANLEHSVTVYTTTPITAPRCPEVEFISAEGSSPLFNLTKAEESNGPISSYQVIVIPWSPECNFNCYSLTAQTYFSSGTDSDGYVAAEFPAKALTDNGSVFALGDRLYYGKFYNAPLKQEKDYCIILRIISEWDEVRTQSCIAWAQIRDVSSKPQHVTAVTLGSVAVLCSVLLLSFFAARAAIHTSQQAALAKRTLADGVRLLSTTKQTITLPSPVTQTFSRV